jgi:hypothetical protein
MYNTNFKVKYYDIEQELLLKINSQNTEAGADHNCNYSIEDINIVCDKLYRDELTSVFYSENILDDKIDDGMRIVLEKITENRDFNSIVVSMKDIILTQTDCLDKDYIDTLIYLTLFSKSLFYLTHKCICQQFSNGKIDKFLLDIFKDQCISCLDNNK